MTDKRLLSWWDYDEIESEIAAKDAEIARLRAALRQIAVLRLATDAGSLRVRADEMWKVAELALTAGKQT